MAMAWLWTGMVAVSLVFGILTGSVGELGGAALEGATAAVELGVSCPNACKTAMNREIAQGF